MQFESATMTQRLRLMARPLEGAKNIADVKKRCKEQQACGGRHLTMH
jgi:hypothetical protein